MCATAGCGRQPLQCSPEVIKLTPDRSKLEDTPHPEWNAVTNDDMNRYVDRADIALDQCNADKAAVRKWADDAQAAP